VIHHPQLIPKGNRTMNTTEPRPSIEREAPEKWVNPFVVALVLDKGIAATRRMIRAGQVPTVIVGKVALIPKIGFAKWLETASIVAYGEGLNTIAEAQRQFDAGKQTKAEPEVLSEGEKKRQRRAVVDKHFDELDRAVADRTTKGAQS
jgi:hypothetical protein